MASFDSNNLMYVTKQYEHEIQDKVKQIHANDETSAIVENVEKQLDDVLREINSKLSFMNAKVIDANQYRIGVHTQIDETKVDVKNLVDDGIEDTLSHPSSTAFKLDRSETKFSTYDFATKMLSFDKNSFIKLNGIQETGEEKVHSFTIKHSTEEYMKIIEFAFVYKQFPTIINKTSEGFVEENTVTVTRVFRGRFFVIWSDPYLEPGKFIIKAIIENADNTGNIIDKKIVDVQRSDSGKDLSIILDDGPQFDLYFTTTGDDITISIGRLTPYRWLIKKQYSNIYGEEKVNFQSINGMRKDVMNIDEIYYSSNCDSYFVVDKTDSKLGYVKSDASLNDIIKLGSNSSITYNGESINRVMFKDAGKYTFVTINSESYVSISNLSSAIHLNKTIDDVFELTTGEIICASGSDLWFFDTTLNNITGLKFVENYNYTPISITPKIIEYKNKAVVFYVNENGQLAYKVKEKYSATGKYQDSNKSYTESLVNDFEINANATAAKIDGIYTPYGIQLAYTESVDSSEISTMFNLDELTITSNIAIFSNINKIRKYDIHTKEYDDDFDFSVKKLVHTPLFTFVIASVLIDGLYKNHLFVIDRERIVDPLKFTEVFDDNNNSLGYTDKNGMIYMKPEENQSEYFIQDNAYLQNVIDITNTPNGIYIVDNNGVYLLNSDKNLKSVFYTDESQIIGNLIYVNRINTCGALVVKLNDGNYNLYKNDYNIKPISDKLLKNDYLDLFSTNYQLYDESVVDYDDDKTIIKFDSILYTTFIDHGSVLYNTDKTENIQYSHDKYISDVDSEKNAIFHRIQEDAISKEYSGVFTPVKLVMTTNKYGFKLYKDILKFDSNKVNVSSFNDIKKYVIRHVKGENISLQAVENTIIKLLDEKYSLLISENGEIKIDQFIIKDKRYWDYLTNTNGRYIDTCLDYFRTFPDPESKPWEGNNSIEADKFYKDFYTPVGKFTQHRTGVITHDFEAYSWSTRNITEKLGISDGRYCNNNSTYHDYFHVDFIDNVYKTVVLGGVTEPDEYDNVFVALYNCYDPETGTYSAPFEDTDKIVKLNDITASAYSVIDGKVYYWNHLDKSEGIFIYDPITKNIDSSTLTSISVMNINHVLNITKIENKIFILGVKNSVNGTEFVQIVYNPTNGSITNLDTNDSNILFIEGNNESSKYLSSKLYNFKKCTLFRIAFTDEREDGIIVLKYDSTLEKFTLSKILPTKIFFNIDFIEIGDKIVGGTVLNNVVSSDNTKQVPNLFEFIPDTNTYIQFHSDSLVECGLGEAGYFRHFFNGIISGSRDAPIVHTVENNDINMWKLDDRFETSMIHNGYEYSIESAVGAGYWRQIPTITAKDIKTGIKYTVFDKTLFDTNGLNTGIYYFETKDENPQSDKTYYQLDQVNTRFVASKLTADYFDASLCNLHNIFIRREISKDMIQLNTKIQTAPISSCTYYTKDLYNNYIECPAGMTSFVEGETYYERECDYIPLTSYLENDTLEELTTGQIFFSSSNPVYKEVTVGSSFNENHTYYERDYFYDVNDPDAEGKDPEHIITHLVPSGEDNGYIIYLFENCGQLYLCIGYNIHFNHPLFNKTIIHFEFLTIDGNTPVEFKDYLTEATNNISAMYVDLDSEYGKFIIGDQNVQLYSDEGELKLNQIFDETISLRLVDDLVSGKRLTSIINGKVYLLGYSVRSGNVKTQSIYRYDPDANKFVKHCSFIGTDKTKIIETEYGLLMGVHKETEFSIYRITDLGTEIILTKQNEILNNHATMINKNGNVDVYVFTKINSDFAKCYKITKGITSEVTLPKEFYTASNLNEFNISALPKTNAILFGSNMIWYLNDNRVESIVNPVYKFPFKLPNGEIDWDEFDATASSIYNSDTLHQTDSFIEIEDVYGNITINYRRNHSMIHKMNGLPSIVLTKGDPFKHGIKFLKNINNDAITLPIETTSEATTIGELNGEEYRINLTDSNYGNVIPLFDRMDSENSKLPLTGKDGSLYFCNARLNKSTGLPDYNNPYRITDSVGVTIKANITFDKMVIHNDCLYGLDKANKKIYVNRNYTESNNFVLSFEDTSALNSLELEVVKHIGLIYLNDTHVWVLPNDEEKRNQTSITNVDGWVDAYTNTTNYLKSYNNLWFNSNYSENKKYIFKTDYIFAVFCENKYIIFESGYNYDALHVFTRSSTYVPKVYETSIGLFFTEVDSSGNETNLYVHSNDGVTILYIDKSSIKTTCINDATKSLNFNNILIYETRNGTIIAVDVNYTTGYYVFEPNSNGEGYVLNPYADDILSNIELCDILTQNYMIEKTSIKDGIYKSRKIIDDLGDYIENDVNVKTQLIRFNVDEYLLICADSSDNSENAIITKISYIKFFKENGEYNLDYITTGEFRYVDLLGKKIFTADYGIIFNNNGVYHNGMIYCFGKNDIGNIYVFNGSISEGKEIVVPEQEASIGFNLTFISKNSDMWNGYAQDMDNSLADKLVIKLTGLYTKTNNSEPKLFNLKAFVVDNYNLDPEMRYSTIKIHNRLSNRFSFILDNNSNDIRDLNINTILNNENVKNILKNLINLDEYDETYNVTMEIYPAVVTDVQKLEIRDELSKNGINITDEYYKLRLNRNPTLPYDPFSNLD